MADKIVAEYNLKVDKAVQNMQKLEKRVLGIEQSAKKTAKNTERQFSQMSSRMGNQFKRLGSQLMAALGVGSAIFVLQKGFRDIINITKNFELQMARVKSITNATDKEFKQLTENAKKLGASTKFTASQVAQLQEEYAKLGFSTQEILKTTEATLLLAEATGSDLATSANIAGAVLRAFGLEASEMQRVVDVMAKSFTTSALDISNFSEAMKFVAPVARAANIDLETTTAMLGTLADANIRGSLAGTGLKNVISKLANENSALSKKLGFTVKSSEDVTKAFQMLAKMNITLTEATALTDERSKASFLTLINNADHLGDLETAYEGAAGAAEDMASIVRDTLKGDLDVLASKYEALAIALGEGEGGLALAARKAAQNWAFYLGKLREAALSEDQLHTEKVTKNLDELRKKADASGLSLVELIDKYSKITVEEAEYTSSLIARGNVDEKTLDNQTALVEAMSRYVTELREQRDAQNDANEETDDGADLVNTYTRNIETLQAELKKYKDTLKTAEIGSAAFYKALSDIKTKAEELKGVLALANLEDALKVDPSEEFEITPVVSDEAVEVLSELERLWLDMFKDSDLDQIMTDELAQAVDAGLEELDRFGEGYQEMQQGITDATITAWQTFTQIASDLTDARYRKDVASLERSLEREQITREQFDKRKNALAKENAKKQKEFAIFQAIINTALGITNAFATAPNIILGAVLAGVVAAAGAAEIGIIASEPLPSFAEGGFIDEKTGRVVGRKHNQGGVKVEVEGDEFVTSAKHARSNAAVLKAINSGQWEQFKNDNIIAPAIEQILQGGGLQNIGASYSLQNTFNDKNMLRAMDRSRQSERDSASMIVDGLVKALKSSKDRYV